MADVLGFVLEDVDDFVAEVQRSFGVQLTSDQLRNCYTFEDLHQLLLASVPNSERLDAGCLGAKAFFRLKRAIEGTDGNGKLMPRTPLSSLTAGCQAYKWLDALERQTGIKMPHTIITQLGCLVMLLTLGLSSLALYAANVHHVLVWMIVLPLSLWLGGLMAHKYFSV
ncbi:MAG TPA: hypothetical protein VJM82_01830, partial [Nitrospiraceae bacterium]|nr:hypothetical protein [Nitrospiraceae bacterium]